MCGDNLASPVAVWDKFRFTPTCVGTTPAILQWGLITPGFTPTCVGTTLNSLGDRVPCHGSPPRVWGQLLHLEMPPATITVHPHVCGDNSVGSAYPTSRSGSPPRVWGQLLKKRLDRATNRFTPTCVGTTRIHFRAEFRVSGSPPRVWGQQSLPAKEASFFSVHPHVCGDNPRRRSNSDASSGSPPRVWGQRLCLRKKHHFFRFTPTCVGTTFVRAVVLVRCAVHPHVCGDNASQRRTSPSGAGSPPRVWGQRRFCH